MGLLNFLFGSNKTNKPTQPIPHRASEEDISYIGDFITIPSIGFFGPSKKSCSGEWVICWADSDETGHRGGHRDKGHGRYVLYNVWQKKVVLQGKLERPNSGRVSDNGIFSIEDWHFGSELSGTLYVFSSSGAELINRKFSANLYNSDISVNGRYAICQTANAPVGEDGNRLTVLDVEGGAELFSIEPPTGWADQYEFNEDSAQFRVVIKDIGTFNYDAEGNLIDAEKFKTARLECDRYNVVLFAAEEILKNPELNNQLAQTALKAATRARAIGADEDQHWKALALKLQGLAHEYLLNNEKALTAFDEALKINPKIGLKRKADSLRKKIAVN